MSLRNLIQDGARTAFSAIGDIKENVSYIVSASKGYDAVSGDVLDAQLVVTVDMVFTSYGASQARDPSLVKEDYTGNLVGYVLKGDRVGELPYLPKSDDLLVRNEDKLKVVGIQSDPTNVLYTLLLERA